MDWDRNRVLVLSGDVQFRHETHLGSRVFTFKTTQFECAQVKSGCAQIADRGTELLLAGLQVSEEADNFQNRHFAGFQQRRTGQRVKVKADVVVAAQLPGDQFDGPATGKAALVYEIRAPARTSFAGTFGPGIQTRKRFQCQRVGQDFLPMRGSVPALMRARLARCRQ